jgi:glycosyltransferase involved in cell wall biosynthesis
VETASVIIANRNYEGLLRQSIDSALAQTRSAEVVVVDDGSSDSSRDVINEYGNRVVPVFRDWAGQAAAINAGVAAASGSILFLLDSDDLADPNRVATIVPLFEEDEELLWVRHSLRAIDDDNQTVVDDLYHFGEKLDVMNYEVLNEGKTPGTTSGLVLRESFFDGLGAIPEHYTTYPDSYLLIRSALVGHGASVQEPLGAHRWHGGSFTAYGWKQIDRAEFHLSLRKNLAEDASEVAQRVDGPEAVAKGSTWWQLKAQAEWRKSGAGDDGQWLNYYSRFVRTTLESQLPARRRIALIARAVGLALLPRQLFRKAWWIAHIGRPSLLRTGTRQKLAQEN